MRCMTASSRLRRGTRALRIGNGLDRAEIGPLVSEAARAKVMRLVEDARAKGAKVVTGGRIPESEQSAGSTSRRS